MKKLLDLAEFHHIGIPITEVQPNEKYSETFDLYTTKGHNAFRVQYHRFGEKSPFHPKIKTMTHVCFKVQNIEEYLEGQKILMELYEPFEGYKAAMIEVEGAPIELIETTMSEEEIWNDDKEGSYMYPAK